LPLPNRSTLTTIWDPWHYLSAGLKSHSECPDRCPRTPPRDVTKLDSPDFSCLQGEGNGMGNTRQCPAGDDGLFASCIASRRDFHIDPHGMMSFCSFIKDPAMRYDLRKGTFRDAWDQFIPSLAGKVRGGEVDKSPADRYPCRDPLRRPEHCPSPRGRVDGVWDMESRGCAESHVR
jgi:hypothetical protein